MNKDLMKEIIIQNINYAFYYAVTETDKEMAFFNAGQVKAYVDDLWMLSGCTLDEKNFIDRACDYAIKGYKWL